MEPTYRILRTLWTIAQATRRAYVLIFKRGDLVEVEWLRKEMRARGFDTPDEQSDAYMRRCVANLRFHGLFYQGEVLDLLDDARVRSDLAEIYRETLYRDQPGDRVDASGFTWWGPPLRTVNPANRELMRSTLREAIRNSAEARENRERRGYT